MRIRLEDIPRGISERDLRLVYPAANVHNIRIDTNHRSDVKDSGYLSIRYAREYDADKMIQSLNSLGIKATQNPWKAAGTKADYSELAKTKWSDANNVAFGTRRKPFTPEKTIKTDRAHESLGQWLGMKKKFEYAAIKPVLARNKK